MKYASLIGKKYGRWTVIEDLGVKNRERYYLCQCDCGVQRSVMGRNLKNSRSTSCGCYKKEINSKQMAEQNKKRSLDLRGQRYGMLTPLEPTDQRLSNSIVWKCKCDCGNITYVSVDNLRGNHPVKSCGCLHRSFGEKEIEKILNDNNILYKNQYIFSDLVDKKYDFFLPDYNRLIEFDGEQHYKNVSNWDRVEVQQQRDKEKNEYALSHNIPLVRIPYWERDNITLDMIMGDKYLVK